MNDKQRSVIGKLRIDILANDSHRNDGYEYKRFEVKEHSGFIEIISEVGLIDDENTLASVFARTRRQIFIGPRGGCRLAGTHVRGYRNVIIAIST